MAKAREMNLHLGKMNREINQEWSREITKIEKSNEIKAMASAKGAGILEILALIEKAGISELKELTTQKMAQVLGNKEYAIFGFQAPTLAQWMKANPQTMALVKVGGEWNHLIWNVIVSGNPEITGRVTHVIVLD